MINTRNVTILFEKLIKKKTPEHQPLALVYDCNFNNSTIFFEQLLQHQGYNNIVQLDVTQFIEEGSYKPTIIAQHLLDLCKNNDNLECKQALILHNYQELDSHIQHEFIQYFNEQAAIIFKEQHKIVPLLMASCHYVDHSTHYDYRLIELDMEVESIQALCDKYSEKQRNTRQIEQKSGFF